MRHDGSFLPVWSEFGRRLALLFISSPKDAQLLERIGNARGLFSICASLAQYQPSTFRVLVALFAISGFMVPTGLAFLGFRFMGRCGGQRVQVITPLYNEMYNGHCVALGSLTISTVIVNVLIVGFAFGIQNSLRETSTFYARGLDELEGYFRTKHTPMPWNRSHLVLKKAALQAQRLDTDFSEAFKEYLQQKLDVNPFESKGPSCGKLLRAMIGDDALLNVNCSILEQAQHQLVQNATQTFKKKTAAERMRLARELWTRAFMVRDSGNGNVKNLGAVKVKFQTFEKKFRLRHLFGSLAPLTMMVLAMVIGVMGALLVIALAMGILNHDRGMAPTLRNTFSHKAGLIMLYCPAVLGLCSMLAVPLAGVLLSGCVVGECYICEPYRGRERHVLDEVATKLLSGDTSLIPSRIIHSCMEPSYRTLRPFNQNVNFELPDQLQRGDADHATEETECETNCTTRMSRLLSLSANGTAELNDEILQPALSDFYIKMVTKAEMMLTQLRVRKRHSTAAECRTVYKVMSQGYSLFCGTLLGNYHGAWSSLLLLSTLMMATAAVSLRLSKFHLVMDQYCYAGWDKRILRKSPRRRKVVRRRHSPRTSFEDLTAQVDDKDSKASVSAEGEQSGDAGTDTQTTENRGDSEEEAGSVGVWDSEAWLLGSLRKGAPSPTAGTAQNTPGEASQSEEQAVEASSEEQAFAADA